MKLDSRRLGILSGLVAPVIFMILYGIAMSKDPNYTFFENYLSDLGVGPGACAFNSGLIITGILLVLFAVFGLRQALPKHWTITIAVAVASISGLFLVSVGVFTENAGDIHGLVSYGFFISALVAVGFLSEGLYRTKALGWLGLGVSLVVFLVGLNLVLMGGTPAVETAAVIMILVWGVLTSILLLMKTPAEGQESSLK